MGRPMTTLAVAAQQVINGKADHVRVGEVVVMRASTFDVLQLSLRKHREWSEMWAKPFDRPELVWGEKPK
jgi:hypothetical protein